jgi:hypothetical protein
MLPVDWLAGERDRIRLVQQRLGLSVGEVWVRYRDAGGACSLDDLESYLFGAPTLPAAEVTRLVRGLDRCGGGQPLRPVGWSEPVIEPVRRLA